MRLRTKVFGLIVSILGLIVSIISFATFAFIDIMLYKATVGSKDGSVGGIISYIIMIVLLIAMVIFTLLIVLFVIYYVFFLIAVIKACKGGSLKIIRKIGIAVSILFIVGSIVLALYPSFSSTDVKYLYILAFFIFAIAVCQLIFYGAHKKEIESFKVENN